MCRYHHLRRHTRLPATKTELLRTFLFSQILILPLRLLHLITGKAPLKYLHSITGAQTDHGHYPWLTQLISGPSISRCLPRLLRKIDLYLKAELSTNTCPIMIKLRNIMLQRTRGRYCHNMTRVNKPLTDLYSTCLQYLPTSRHHLGHLHPGEPHLRGLW